MNTKDFDLAIICNDCHIKYATGIKCRTTNPKNCHFCNKLIAKNTDTAHLVAISYARATLKRTIIAKKGN